MKKYFSYALVGAIALTGAVGFSSCSSSSDEVVGNNPSYNSEQNSVKTQFTISFPSNVARANTRQSADIVQNTPAIASFRGMKDIVLLPFGATGDAGTDPISSSSTKLSNAITLSTIIVPTPAGTYPSNSIPAGLLKANSNSVLYNDVTIPVGTGSFLFYGKAIDDGTENFVNGSLAFDGTQPANITFTPVQTYPGTASKTGEYLADYLSKIAQAENWAECTVTTNSGETWYSIGLGDLYTQFTSLKTGSSLDVQAAIEDLYQTIKDNTDAVSTKIKSQILNAEVKNTTENEKYASVSGTTLTFNAKLGNGFTTTGGKTLYFPFDVNLPDGAALLSYNSGTKTFTQVTNGNGNTGDKITAKYTDYVYPASLYYYCNSGITTSASSKKSLYEDTENNYDWAAITGPTNYEAGSYVKPSTRSVAILDPIQYAVGRLDATVKLKENVATLYDHNGEAYAVNPTDGFTVTGILIGGQKQVKYDFTTNTTADEYTIYDNITKSNGTITVKSATASAPNYTLALETKAGESVYVAVELLNNGDDFQGIDGVVPAGCKFYLVAQLTPSTGSGYDATTMNQVFRQDYKTIANFTIPTGYAKTDTAAGHFDPTTGNTVGLGKAYNTIPDLRSPKLELGLSVDLTWQQGITFNDVEF